MPGTPCSLVLDLGTSSMKCGVVDAAGGVRCSEAAAFELQRDGPACEVDFERCADVALAALKRVADQAPAGCEIEAVLLTSQAQTFVPVDESFSPLCPGIVWLDSRADAEADRLAERLPDFARTAGFQRPMPSLYVSHLLRLKTQSPGLFTRAAAFPLIGTYIGRRLTGRAYTDSCNFGMGGVYDIRRRTLNGRVLDLLGLTPGHFPEVADAAVLSYPLRPEVAAELGVGRVPVCFCGNDQSASAVGAGLESVGDVSVNFGTVLAAYTLLPEPPDDLGPDEIAGISPVDGLYFLLTYDPETGAVVDRARAGGESYEAFFGGYGSGGEADRAIRHCLERFRFHLSRIERAARPERVRVSGGMTQSAAWLELLRRHCDHEVVCVNRRDAALAGAARIYAMREQKREARDE